MSVVFIEPCGSHLNADGKPSAVRSVMYHIALPVKNKSSNVNARIKLLVTSLEILRSHVRGAIGIFSIHSPFHISLYICNGMHAITDAIKSLARLTVGTDMAALRAFDSV